MATESDRQARRQYGGMLDQCSDHDGVIVVYIGNECPLCAALAKVEEIDQERLAAEQEVEELRKGVPDGPTDKSLLRAVQSLLAHRATIAGPTSEYSTVVASRDIKACQAAIDAADQS